MKNNHQWRKLGVLFKWQIYPDVHFKNLRSSLNHLCKISNILHFKMFIYCIYALSHFGSTLIVNLCSSTTPLHWWFSNSTWIKICGGGLRMFEGQGACQDRGNMMGTLSYSVPLKDLLQDTLFFSVSWKDTVQGTLSHLSTEIHHKRYFIIFCPVQGHLRRNFTFYVP